MIRDSQDNYGIISIFFHWLSAALTIFLLGLGIYLTSYGYYSGDYLQYAHMHYALGMLLFGLIGIRLLWRLTSKTPRTLANKLPAKLGIKLIKFLLYMLLLTVLVSGYFICTSEGQTINVFGWFEVPSIMLLETHQLNLAGLIHKYIAWVLIGLIILHTGAALIHHFFIRDRTLVRMIWPRKKTFQ